MPGLGSPVQNPSGPGSRPKGGGRSAPKIYVPPPVMHVAARAPAPVVRRGPPTRPARTLAYNPRVGTPRGTKIATRPGGATRAQRQALRPVRQGTPRGTGYTVSQMARQGQAQARAETSYLHSPGYRKALVSVFMHQPDAQKALLLNKAAKLPASDPTRQILASIKQSAIPGSTGLSEAAIHAQTAGIDPQGVFKVLKTGLSHSLSDIWNLPLGTLEAGVQTGLPALRGMGDILTGNTQGFLKNEGTVVKNVGGPYVHLAEHPLATFEAHPVNTLLMLQGLESVLGRGVGAGLRAAPSDVLRKAGSYARPDLHLGTVGEDNTPSPITESRYYSKDAFRKALQVSSDQIKRRRGQDPNVSKPAPKFLPPQVAYALNVGTEAKIRRITDEMTAVQQMESRGQRTRVLKAIMKHKPKGPAGNIITHVLQGVLRNRDTAAADLEHEINRLKANRPAPRTLARVLNDRQVAHLEKARDTPGAIGAAFDAADKIRPTLSAQDEALIAHGLLDPEQALRAKLIPYAMAHMGVKYDHQLGKFVEPGSRRLPPTVAEQRAGARGVRYGRTQEIATQKIVDHLNANGVPEPAFVGHRPTTSARHFYQAYKLARGSLSKARTGEAFRTGAYDHTFEGLAGHVASRAQSLAKATLHDKVVNRISLTLAPDQMRKVLQEAGVKPMQISKAINTGRFTKREADAIAYAIGHDKAGNEIPGALQVTPISAVPATVLDHVADLQHPKELGNLSDLELRVLTHAVTDATRADVNSPARNIALAPTIATDNFAAHFARSDATLRAVGKVTQQFRRTVLPYSTHWAFQTITEAGLRSLLTGNLSVRKYIDGWRVAHALKDTEAGQAALSEMVGSVQGNLHDNLGIHTMGTLGRLGHAFPPTHLIIQGHKRFADMVMHGIGALEHQTRIMALGGLAHKDAQAFGRSWKDAVLLQGKTVEQLATKAKADPALVAKFGRQIDDVLGKYNKFTPTQRSMIQSFMPFLPWYLTASKFVFLHLPLHHPVASGLMASARQTLTQDMAEGKKAPLGLWAVQALARLSPFGIFTQATTDMSFNQLMKGMNLLPGAIAPQVLGGAYAVAGVNPFGDAPLKGPPSELNPSGTVKPGEGWPQAIEQWAEGVLPLLNKVRIAREGGRPSYGTSNVVNPQPKSGTKGDLLDKLVNPISSIQSVMGQGPPYGTAKQQAAAYGGSSGGGASVGSDGFLRPGRASKRTGPSGKGMSVGADGFLHPGGG